MSRTSSRILASVAVGLLGGTVLVADGSQTGTMAGHVKDSKGMPVVGAQIRLTSATLMGPRIQITGATGEFRVPLLPPGTAYTVTVTATGFQTATLPAKVNVNQIYQLNVTMQAVAQTVVEVVANASSIDTTSTTAQFNMTKELVDSLPMGRDYQSVMTLTPGLADAAGDGNPTALGGRNSENIYLVDGVDTTDATVGKFGMNLNEEAIEEIQILTTAISAEYGRFNGAVSNVVTKSGSNNFEGAIRYDFNNLAWDALGKRNTKPESKMTTTPFISVSGPILKDKLWFYLSGQIPKTDGNMSTTGPIWGQGVSYTRAFKADPAWYSAKLTWQVGQNHRITLQATGDPTKITPGDAYCTTTTLDTLTWQKQGGDFLSLSYAGAVSSELTLEAKVAKQESYIKVGSPVGSKWAFIDFADPLQRYYENGPYEGYVKRPRTQFNAAVTWYPTLAGTHQVRAGVDYQNTKSKNKFGSPGNAVVVFYGFDENRNYNTAELWTYTPPEESSSDQKYTALYVNDKWKITDNWSMNLGLRTEKVKGSNDIGQQIWDYHTFSPRLGLTYDWKGDGLQNVGLFYARYDQAPWQMGLDDMGRLAQSEFDYAYVSGDPHLRSSYGTVPIWSSVPQTNPYLRFDPNLKGSYQEEWTLSYKAQLTGRLTFQSQAVYRDFKNPIVNFTYYEEPDSQAKVKLLANAPDARRTYRGLINSMEYSGEKWFISGSWTLSSLMGNIDADDTSATYGQLFQGLYHPSFNMNRAYGYLAADQTHIARLSATYRMDFGKSLNLTHGFRFSYASGTPWTLRGTWQDENAPAWVKSDDTLFTVRAGGLRGNNRYPDTYRVHYTATLNFKLTDRISGYFRTDIFNLLNTYRLETYNTATTVHGSYANPADPTTLQGFSFEPGQNFGRATDPSMWTPGRQLQFTVGLKF